MEELIAALFEAIFSLIAGIIEAIASLFTAGTQTLGAGEALLMFFLLLVELVLWGILLALELIVALVNWRKPKRVKKPVLWRPSKLKQNKKGPDSAHQNT